MNRFARWIVKHRVAVVIICLLMLIPSVLGMNATKVKYDLLYYLPEDLDTVKGQNILMEEFGKGAFSLCITEGMSETDQQALEDAIRDVPHVDTVIGYASITVRKQLLRPAHPAVFLFLRLNLHRILFCHHGDPLVFQLFCQFC